MTSPVNQDREWLHSILDAIANIRTHQESKGNQFTIERAVIFELITIGEAMKRISEEIKESYSAVPWKRIADSRNRMVHNYEDISTKIVWDIVENHLPVLQHQIEHILIRMGQ